ncbi:MAG: acyl--CoA ligase [Bacteroidales bacterium]|nr:acyl--CoA ligase [Bacteroidales bacterium]
MIFEDYLKRNAELYPEKTAVICGNNSLTYSQLWQEVLTKSANLPKNKAVAFRVSQDFEFLFTYFALHINGSVAVPLEKDVPEDGFNEVANLIEGIKTPEGTADILFTTGTTGKKKGVMISHRAIIADGENLIEGQAFTHDTAFVITGPFNHIASLSKIYPVVIKGATLIITEGMKNVNDFFAALDLPFNKFATFLVPSAIRILLQFSGEKLRRYVSKLDFIETGAAPISHSDMQKLCETLPQTRLYNTYASTETGIISTYNFNDLRCIEGCLGRPMSHSKIIITTEGLISCQGDTIMSGYAGDDELTAKVLKNNTIYTSDFGRIDEEGMLRLSGRIDDVINTGGFKVAPTEVESVALSMPQITDCICVAAPHPILSTALKLIYVASTSVTKKEIALYIKSKLESFKVPVFYEQADKIQRTYNGKIDRKFYRQNPQQ